MDFNQDATSQSVTDRGKGFRDEMIKLITTADQAPPGRHQGDGQPGLHRARQPHQREGHHHRRGGPGFAERHGRDQYGRGGAEPRQVGQHRRHLLLERRDGTSDPCLHHDGSALPKQYPGLVVIGFDAGKAQKAAIRNKYFLGAITQDPYNIGFKAVELAYKAIKGEPVANVDTGAKFYDSTNMDHPDIAQLLYD